LRSRRSGWRWRASGCGGYNEGEMAKKKKKIKVGAVIAANRGNAKVAPVAKVSPEAKAVEAQGEYSEALQPLFSLGETDFNQKWPDYAALAVFGADEEELTRLACDARLDFAASWLVGSAPVHAMRILALRKNTDFLRPLFATFGERDDHDLFREDVPKLLRAIGAPAIPVIQEFFARTDEDVFDRALVLGALHEIGLSDRALRPRVVDILIATLTNYKENLEEINGFLIGDLLELSAGEALPLIERAFADECVDDTICGDLEDVRTEFGLGVPRRDTGPLFLQDTCSQLPNPMRRLLANKTPKP